MINFVHYQNLIITNQYLTVYPHTRVFYYLNSFFAVFNKQSRHKSSNLSKLKKQPHQKYQTTFIIKSQQHYITYLIIYIPIEKYRQILTVRNFTLIMYNQLHRHYEPISLDLNSRLSLNTLVAIVLGSCLIGILWAIWNYLQVRKINLEATETYANGVTKQQIDSVKDIGSKIHEGAKQFLKQEYLVCLIFIAVMFLIIWGAIEKFKTPYTSVAFLIGSITSIISGAIGMMIATYTNYRVTYCAKKGLDEAFKTAYRGGCVMGFALVSIALLTLLLLILAYQRMMGYQNFAGIQTHYYQRLFEAIAGYGLGGSTVALFGRVGGGIYTKAADVGADLVGKVERNLPEDSPKNPATIADNVGDNVGDIAGMGADLFGSFAQSTCAALVVSSTTLFSSTEIHQVSQFIYLQNLMFPLVLTAFGIIVCLLTSFFGIYVSRVNQQSKIQSTLKYQIVISTVLLLGFLYLAAIYTFPANFVIAGRVATQILHPYHAYLCAAFGLIAGMIIGWFTEYMTSHTYSPVRQVANSCRTGAATNIIYGLALGYLSTIVPVLCIGLTAYGSCKILGYYGVALAALGMLSNLPISLAIDGYGPISDNAGGIAEMAEMGEDTRNKTDALDAAGNTTAAIGKGFAIGSAALVSLSLYGGYLHIVRLRAEEIALTEPMVFTGLLVGAMLPYAFSALTMKSVGKAALGMVQQIRRQIKEKPGILEGTVEPDYKACIKISTRASLIQMIAPGCLVIFTPILIGLIFGPKAVAGFLPGALVSGVQMAISASNTGGAWDNAKKYIQGNNMTDDGGNIVGKGSDIHKAAVVGDTVGDPLKDTSGPALNILIKLMAILSLVFATLFLRFHPSS